MASLIKMKVTKRRLVPSLAQIAGLCALLLSATHAYASVFTFEDRNEFLNSAGTVSSEGFEALTPMTGGDVLLSIPLVDLNNRMEISVSSPGVLQANAAFLQPPSQLGQTLLFSNSHQTINNISWIRFHNFGGTNQEINAFGFYIVDFANSNQIGNQLRFTTDSGESGVLTESMGPLPANQVRYFGIITSKPFNEISLSTSPGEGMVWFDEISFGIAGLSPPHVTDDLMKGLLTTSICEGSLQTHPRDLDGLSNGTAYDPNETLLVLWPINGRAAGESLGDNNTLLYYSYANSNCPPPHCSPNCPSGKLAVRFADMRVEGFSINDPSTWVYRSVPKASFRAKYSNPPRENTTSPYSQVKVYKVANSGQPSDQIDHSPTQPITENWEDYNFEDADDGIAELLFRTDYITNWIDALVVTSKAGNTSLGDNVVVSEGSAHLTFSAVVEMGITDVQTSSTGPDVSGNFRACDPPVYYNINTTAEYTGAIQVCVDIPASCTGNGLSLQHFENGAWTELTTTRENSKLCGQVTSLSPFMVGMAVINTHWIYGIPYWTYTLLFIALGLFILWWRRK